MAGKSASLLTKTQRQRIRNEFDDLEEEKKRRDQQRIRDRVRSGVLDFQLLVDFPDQQFEMAFDDCSDEETRAALADAFLVLERLRELTDYDREELIADARLRADAIEDGGPAPRTLGQLDLESSAEVRERTEAAMRERYGPSRWDRLASRAMKLAGGSLVTAVVLRGLDLVIGTSFTLDGGNGTPLLALLVALICTGFAVWGVIAVARSFKYDVVPVVSTLVREPRTAVDGVLGLVRKPGQTLRNAWEEL